MSNKNKLEQIEKKVNEAKILINEAKALAEEAGVEFTVAITGTFEAESSTSDFESSDWNDSGCTW